MNRERFCPPYSDEAIVAWLDAEMDAEEAHAFEQQLKRDNVLAARTAELMKSNQPFAEAFEPLLASAPSARLHANLNHLLARTAETPPAARAQVSRRALIAASLSFLVIGSGFGYFVRPDNRSRRESEKIRDLESQYMSLYSPETLVDVDSSAPVIDRSLVRTAQTLGLHLNAQQLTLQDAELKSVRLLRYDEASIAQISWEHSTYGPMALCVSREDHHRATPVQSEQRYGMNLAWWHAGGYQYVLIGRSPAAWLQQSAVLLRQGLMSA